jgi:hypothetical protein
MRTLTLVCGIATLAWLLAFASPAQAFDTGLVDFEDLPVETGTPLHLTTTGYHWVVDGRKVNHTNATYGADAAWQHIENGLVTADPGDGSHGNVLIPGPNKYATPNGTVAEQIAKNNTGGKGIGIVFETPLTAADGVHTLEYDVYFTNVGGRSIEHGVGGQGAAHGCCDGFAGIGKDVLLQTWNPYASGGSSIRLNVPGVGAYDPDGDGDLKDDDFQPDIQSNTWHSIKETWDIANGTFDLSVDGTLVIDDFPMVDSDGATVHTIKGTSLGHGGHSNWPAVYIDNFRVSPEPTTALVVGAGIALAFGVRRRRQS